jgi:fatty acid desaturase
MSEEVRFFLRVAAHTAFIATVYWFVSYEPAGTALLLFLLAATVTFSFVVLTHVAAARGASSARPNILRHVFGFDEPASSASDPLQIKEDLYPTATLWPLGLALGVTLGALGLLYGSWLWIPGLAMTLGCGISWLTELDHS